MIPARLHLQRVQLLLIVRALERGDVYLLHLQHGIHGALSFLGIRIAYQSWQSVWDDLP